MKTKGESINEGWWPDWGNINDHKYWPLFYVESGAFTGFAYATASTAASITYAYFGSRLCFKSEELATLKWT
jgi:hypothetical protein